MEPSSLESKSPSIFRSWLNVLTQPGEEIFEEERHRVSATTSTALKWVAVSALVSAIIGTLSTALMGASSLSGMMEQFQSAGLPPEQVAMIESVMQFFLSPAGIVSSFIASLVFSILGFLLGVGLTHLISKMFGGQGTFGRTAYLQSLFMVPIRLVSAPLSLVPLAGQCLNAILSIYSIVLWFFSTKTEQRLTTGKTIGVAIVAGIAFLAFFACIGVLLSTVLFARFDGPIPQ